MPSGPEKMLSPPCRVQCRSRTTIACLFFHEVQRALQLQFLEPYVQLDHSPLLLGLTVIGMAITYVAPLALALVGGAPMVLGLLAWAAMSLAYLPTLRRSLAIWRRSRTVFPCRLQVALRQMNCGRLPQLHSLRGQRRSRHSLKNRRSRLKRPLSWC